LPLADVLWWWWADRAVRRLTRAKWWRAAVAIFCAIQLFGFLLVVGGRFALPWGATTMPTTMLASRFLWHLLVLPFVAGTMLMSNAFRGIARLFRRTPPRDNIE